MGEDIIPFFGEVKDQMQGIIKVVGVGGGGCNAVGNMYKERVEGVTYAVCNTDSQSLSRSPVPVKIQLGEGLGAGGNPEKGKAEEAIMRRKNAIMEAARSNVRPRSSAKHVKPTE